MEWSHNFNSIDDVALYLIANLRPLSEQDRAQSVPEDLKGQLVLCYGRPGKMHYVAQFAKGFHFWIGDTLYASEKSLATLIHSVAVSYATDFLD